VRRCRPMTVIALGAARLQESVISTSVATG